MISVVTLGSTGTPVVVGVVVADASGHYSITSEALTDGTYTVTTTTVNEAGVAMGQTTTATVVIDTVAPRVVSLSFRRRSRRLSLTLVDDVSGIDFMFTSPILPDFRFTRLRGPRAGINLINGFSSSGTSQAPAFTAEFLVNDGRALRSGRYRFQVASGGLTDVAGNALDGEFTGTFPTGDGVPRGGLRARFTVNHGRISGPLPIAPIVSPLAETVSQLHDLALGEIVVPKAWKKK